MFVDEIDGVYTIYPAFVSLGKGAPLVAQTSGPCFLIRTIDETFNSFSCAVWSEDLTSLMLRHMMYRHTLCRNCLKFVPCLPGVQRRLCFPRVVRDRRWYLCERVFAKRTFFSSLLRICSADMGIDDLGGMGGRPTLGDDVRREV